MKQPDETFWFGQLQFVSGLFLGILLAHAQQGEIGKGLSFAILTVILYLPLRYLIWHLLKL